MKWEAIVARRTGKFSLKWNRRHRIRSYTYFDLSAITIHFYFFSLFNYIQSIYAY